MATHALSPAAQAYSRGTLYDWLTTTDHKKIGIMYVINSFIFFLVGGVLALVVRTELAQPGLQYLTNEHVYNEMFTMHATLMIFVFVIPMLAGLGNYAVPLMIGAPDMAFPRINDLSLWMLPLGGLLLISSFFRRGHDHEDTRHQDRPDHDRHPEEGHPGRPHLEDRHEEVDAAQDGARADEDEGHDPEVLSGTR